MNVADPRRRYIPATFQARGVATPFTTPLLGGTRVRAAPKTRIELVSRNPVESRGVCVTPWTDLALLCRPTLHDRVLLTAIAELDRISPATIRKAARAVAAEGLAGDPAMEAAQYAAGCDANIAATEREGLLAALQRQTGGPPIADRGTDDLANLPDDWFASHASQSGELAAGALDALAEVIASTGAMGGVPRVIAMVRLVREEMLEWSRTQWPHAWMECVRSIAAVAEVTLSLAAQALAKARLATEDMVGLLRTWQTDPSVIVRLAEQPEWLLDGWETICLIWNDAHDDTGHCAALIEIVERIPIMPAEVTEWAGDISDLVVRRPISLAVEWRNGATVYDLIARNEHFRAIAA
jgi:hypothetical protein